MNHAITPGTIEPGFYEDPLDQVLDEIWDEAAIEAQDPRVIWDAIGDLPEIGLFVGAAVKHAMAHSPQLRRPIMAYLARQTAGEITKGCGAWERSQVMEALEQSIGKGNY